MAGSSSLTASVPRPSLRSLQFALATAAIHVYFVSYTISIVNVPGSLAHEPDWVVGVVVGALGFAGMFMRPLAGVWVDSGRRERWVYLGAAGTIVAFVGYGLSIEPWLMLPFRMLHGISMGLFTTALLAMVASHIPPERRGFGLGLYQGGNAAAQLWAAPFAVWLALRSSFELTFFVGAGFAALALLAGSRVSDLEPPSGARIPWRRREWLSASARFPALVFLSMTTTFGAITAFLPLLANERDLGNVGLYYTVFGITLLAARFVGGVTADRFGHTRVVVPALVAGAGALFLLAGAHSQAMLLTSAAISGIALGEVQVSIMSIIIERTPAAGRGAAMATFTMAWDIGAVLGGVVLGFVIEASSLGFGFALVGLLPLAGIAVFLLAVVPRPAPPSSGNGVAAGGIPGGGPTAIDGGAIDGGAIRRGASDGGAGAGSVEGARAPRR